jgi:nitrate/nitrite transporter NarK
MGVFSVASIFSELGNGACFALVPHLPRNVRCSLHLRVGRVDDDDTDNCSCFF